MSSRAKAATKSQRKTPRLGTKKPAARQRQRRSKAKKTIEVLGVQAVAIARNYLYL
jgi:hypothetical protein